MTVHIHSVAAPVTWPLRQSVLRPHQAPSQLALPDDDDPSTLTFAALDDDGTVIGCGRVAVASPPQSLATVSVVHAPDGRSWRLRAMAVVPGRRNAGVGTALVERAVAHVASQGGGLLWCNARLPARSLYRRSGFVEHGERWDDPDLGPHVVMWRTVEEAGGL